MANLQEKNSVSNCSVRISNLESIETLARNKFVAYVVTAQNACGQNIMSNSSERNMLQRLQANLSVLTILNSEGRAVIYYRLLNS